MITVTSDEVEEGSRSWLRTGRIFTSLRASCLLLARAQISASIRYVHISRIYVSLHPLLPFLPGIRGGPGHLCDFHLRYFRLARTIRLWTDAKELRIRNLPEILEHSPINAGAETYITHTSTIVQAVSEADVCRVGAWSFTCGSSISNIACARDSARKSLKPDIATGLDIIHQALRHHIPPLRLETDPSYHLVFIPMPRRTHLVSRQGHHPRPAYEPQQRTQEQDSLVNTRRGPAVTQNKMHHAACPQVMCDDPAIVIFQPLLYLERMPLSPAARRHSDVLQVLHINRQ